MNSENIEHLRSVIALRDIPDVHLEWILERAEYTEYEDSDIMLRKGEEVEHLGLIFEGRGNFYMDVNGKLVYYYTFENNEETGGTYGLLPYSRMTHTPGNIYAVGKVKLFLLHKKYFHDLEQLNPDLMQRLIGFMTERAKSMATRKSQLEKVQALGQLSAGIAHELNNPASAISRNSEELYKIFRRNHELTEKLLMLKISPVLIQNIRGRAELKRKEQKIKLTAIQKMEREDQITDWLMDKGFSEYRSLAESFSEAGFMTDDIEFIMYNTVSETFIPVLLWLENFLSSQRLLDDLGIASAQISSLVGAIKSHVRMDRSDAKELCDIHKDIDNTLILLGHKIRDKNIKVKKDFCENLIEFPAFTGELNQVWTNLIDNAIFALEKSGTIKINTTCDEKCVTVRITDDGKGIPKEIVSRIFDPFFTTKKVGEGTGIGLDLVSRIIKHHDGEVKVRSVPGSTEFMVRLPINK